MRNVAQVAKREILDKRVLVNGVTASAPMYIAVDTAGNEEWAVDVYIGPLLDQSIIYRVPIVPAAKQLITDIRQPVQLERSKQGFYTVVGRAKVMSAGAQTPDSSILEPTFREIEVNLAELDIRHVADLDYAAAPFQVDDNQEFQADPDQPFQAITVTDAFGHLVTDDPENDCADAANAVGFEPARRGKTRHVVIDVQTFGEMRWGVPGSLFQEATQTVIELED